MSTYFVGDIHGCYKELLLLLKKVNFCPQKDSLWTTGDLVGRGKNSLEVLQYLYSLGKSAKIVLGNHDINLILAYKNKNFVKSYMKTLLKSKDFETLITWLRNQPLARINEKKNFIMTHAGVYPKWNTKNIKIFSKEIHNMLITPKFTKILELVRDNKTTNWDKNACTIDKFKFIINSFTRMRYCFKNCSLELNSKMNPKDQKNNKLIPWFRIKNESIKNFTIIFGHWSSLQGKGTPKNIIAMDTGCCWGKYLTILKWENKKIYTQSSLQ